MPRVRGPIDRPGEREGQLLKKVLTYIEQSMPEAVKNVVVISAAGDAQLKELERRGACGVILPKPFDPEEFYQRIAPCIRGPYDPSQFSPESDSDLTNDSA